jgi:hypothetical protein
VHSTSQTVEDVGTLSVAACPISLKGQTCCGGVVASVHIRQECVDNSEE